MKKVWIIKDLWDETYKVAEKYSESMGKWNTRLIYAAQYESYKEAEKDVIPNSTIIEMFINE